MPVWSAEPAAFGRALRRVVWLGLFFAAPACGDASQWQAGTPAPDPELFEQRVYPMLLRNCAFTSCHGDERRFFQVYGPGRTRADPKQMPSDPPTRVEIQRSYDRARSMLSTAAHPADSLLLRKPLEATQGGEGHKGVDALGRNVFRSQDDADYMLLLRWATSRGKSAVVAAPPPRDAGSGSVDRGDAGMRP